jgi:hypothetical protein
MAARESTVMIITGKHLSRRTVLRGIGVTIALPLLDSMVPAFAAPSPVRRFGAIYVGMGMNMHLWSQPSGGELQMNPILQPLAGFRDRLVVLGGLDNIQALSNADSGQHPRAQSSWLTGCRAKKTDGPDIHLGTSLDQIIAKELAHETQLGSLELALEPTDIVGNCAYGFSCAYNNTIAWRSPTTPLPMENNPRNVFERLFGASDSTDSAVRRRQLRVDKSILDAVRADIGGVEGRLGPRDRQKLDEYLDAVRDVERRVQRAEQQASRELPVVEQPVGIPGTLREHAQLMMDLQLLAFQTDLTRVFTFVVAREGSTRSYPEIGVADSHHPLSHHQNNGEKLARLAKLNTFHVSQLAYFVDRLQKTVDGDGTLLDSTLLLYGSGMSDGHMHIPKNVPTLLVAGKAFGISGNRSIQYRPDDGTPLANLQLSLLERFGLAVEKFGDSNGELKQLSGLA